MLLNYFAQPTLIGSNNIFFDVDEFKKSPILLCRGNALDSKLLPCDWSGHIYATENILNATSNNIKTLNTKVLSPNETCNISLGNDGSQCRVKDIDLTAIHWDKDNLIFLIKADNVTNLLTDMITSEMDVFIQNKILRNAIKTGIDVLYVNDGIYNKTQQLIIHPTECVLGALVTLVKPRFVHGLSGAERLPQYITNCCNNK